MRAAALICSAALTAAGPALAEPLDTKPDWLEAPAPELMARAWPVGASLEDARVVLECTVLTTGQLTDCSVMSETRPGLGFGAAALKMTQSFKFKPGARGGHPVASRVTVPIHFKARLETSPQWVRLPDAEAFSAVFPVKAMNDGQDGHVVLQCEILATGALEGCAVIEETPKDYGFGAAALALAPHFLLKPGKQDGKATRSAVRIPIGFKSTTRAPKTGHRVNPTHPEVRGTPLVAKPVWLEAPSFAEWRAAWPGEAREQVGHVALTCKVIASGRLDDCKPVTEFPERQGFGRAAKSLAPKFRLLMTPEIEAGKAEVNVPIRFVDPKSPEGLKPSIVKPDWISQIDPDKLAAVYPTAAADAQIKSGKGVADCLVARDGALTDCKPGGEQPEGYGFAASAVAVASVMKMNPWSQGGGPVDGARIRLPVTFNLAQGQPPKP